MVSWLAPLLGAAVGGFFTNKAAGSSKRQQAAANAQNIAFQTAQNAADRNVQVKQFQHSSNMAKNQFNRSMSMADQQFQTQLAEAEKDRALQKEFAQNGVQWRVQDATAAGLHPLAALGAQLASSSPISISGNVPSGGLPSPTASALPAPQVSADTTGPQLMASMGQDLSRAIAATATEYERQKEVERASQALSLENQALQNKYVAAQIAKTRGASVGPAMPSTRTTYMIAGQGNSPSKLVVDQPNKRNATAKGAPHLEPYDFADTGFSRTATGWAPQMSETVKERTEDDILAEIPWHIRNRVLPTSLGGTGPPRHVKLKPGEKWEWNTLGQEWRIDRGAGRRSNIKVWLPNAQ